MKCHPALPCPALWLAPLPCEGGCMSRCSQRVGLPGSEFFLAHESLSSFLSPVFSRDRMAPEHPCRQMATAQSAPSALPGVRPWPGRPNVLGDLTSCFFVHN